MNTYRRVWVGAWAGRVQVCGLMLGGMHTGTHAGVQRREQRGRVGEGACGANRRAVQQGCVGLERKRGAAALCLGLMGQLQTQALSRTRWASKNHCPCSKSVGGRASLCSRDCWVQQKRRTLRFAL